MTAPRPVLFGEILFDRFPDGAASLGGAPFNVAAHLAGLGERPILVTRVGDDGAGRRALAELERRGVDARAVQRDPGRATGEVRVELVDGEPRFEILAGRAWDAIDGDAALAALRGVPIAILYHGVLAARERASARALRSVRELAATARFVDVNLRPPWTPRERALELGRGAAWLKVNVAELAELADGAAEADPDAIGRDAARLLERTGAERLVVTRGARGALLVAPGASPESVAAPVRPATTDGDPVGAGDAFSAVLLLAALRAWPLPLTLARAAELAAAVCDLRGALPREDGWHAPFRRRWEAA